MKVIDIPLSKDSNIQFICSCGNMATGNFTIFDLRERARCEECYEKIGYENHVSTMIERYGVANATHAPELFKKLQNSSFKWKQFTLPSGRVINVQGFETFALRDLVKVYDEKYIKAGRSAKDIPVISYTFDGKNKKYYPDIYISAENKIIEVKSVYTYNLHLKQNHAKRDACLDQGYKFEFMIYNKKGIKIKV